VDFEILSNSLTFECRNPPTSGMFYWIRSLQTYNEGWSYMSQIKAFVRGGMKDDSFINAVSGIVNRGCHK